ncbi:G5 domain-containing protein [Streptococcus sp. Marseille-Q7156]
MKDIFNKRQRFSIRKFSVGVASVLIGIALFTPAQGVLASTENNLATEIGANSEKENATSTVEKKEENQNSPENQGAISSPAPKDTPIGSTRTTEPGTSGDKGNNSLTTRDFVAGEDRSSTTPAVRAASNPSEVKKYELTDEYAKQIKAGVIGSEGNKLDSLLLNGPQLSPESYTDNDYLKDKEELYIYEKDGKKYVGYNSHPLLEDTDGDGIIDSKEKPDEKLKWNVSERDMIMFMELSYRDDNYIDRVLDHKKPLTESELYKKNGDSKPRYEYMMMNKELGPYWERKKSYHTSSGLDAVLYETKSDFLYLPNGTAQVLAFRGTSDAKDIGADIRLGLGSNPQQGIDAENIMRELAKDKSITNLYLTGHSLGGYLVQRAMVEAYQLAYSDSRVMSPKEQRAYRNFYNNVLKKGTTFNAPKVVTSLVSGRDFWQKGLDSKKIAKSGKLTHYIVDNDSTIRKGVSNDSDVVINVGRTSGGHSSRSYFEADLINRRSEFISGKRISLDGTGYQDKKITTVKSVEKVGETAVYSKRGDDIIKSTTVSMKNPDTGQITKNTLDEVFKKNGAKSKVVVTPIQPSVRYEKDATKAKGEAKITIAGTPGTRTVTTTYTVNPTDGNLIPHEGKPVIKPSIPTVVKVPAKDEVEYLKEGDDVVKKTTTYAVNASTGALTPTEKKEIFKQNGAKSKVVVTSIEPSVRYEKDATKAKGEAKITVAGTPGTRTVTTTYTVKPTDGSLIPHEGKPFIKPSTPTVVKVPAKDEVEYLKEGDDVVKKTTTYAVNASTGALTPTETTEIFNRNGAKAKVVVTPIHPSVRYEKDATKAKGEAKITVAGTPGTRTVTTTYTVNSTDGNLIPHEEKPVIKPSTPTVVKVPAKDEVEYLKEGDDVVKKTTTYAVNVSTGALTPTEKNEVFKKDGAKSKVVVTPIEPSIRYEKDATKAKGEAKITVAGTPGTRTVTTTYTVNSTDGNLIPHEEPAVVVPSKPTVVKVPAKDEVEYLKEGDDVVKKTTSYEVNASTGALTPTVRRDIASPNGVKSKVVTKIIPVTTRYEADKTKDVGTNTVTNNGSEGKVVTTTSTLVNENNGTVTDGTPIVSRTEMVPKVVKVGAKDKVVETPIEPEVEYVKDVEKDFGTPAQHTEGEKGKTVTTTTYDVDPNDGHITEHVGNPVVTPAGKTIVKVGAKTKVEQSKDSEGRDVIDTTTYEVDPKTGKVTPTTVRTYGKTKEPTVEKRVVPSPVVYEKDDSRDKDSEPVRKEGTPGEETITTTYTVDPNTGAITPTVGKPVRTKEPTETVVKVAAKDKVETTEIPSPKKYVKDDTRDKDQPNVEEAGQAGSSTTTTTYSVDSTTGAITERVGKPVVVNPTATIVKVAAKDKVVEIPIEPEVEYVRDGEREVDTPNERVEGAKGKTVTTTTYDVDPKDGHITEHVGNPVVSPAGKTIVKVGAKTKVEQSKDSEGLDVIDTTTYEVDPKTGKVTPTTVRTYGKTKEPTVEKRVVPSPVVYEKDDTKEKGTAPTTVKGEDGEDTITTTYTVDPNTGKITASEGQPVRTKEPTNTIVKVAAKDKVETTAIPSPKKYVKDDTRDKDQPNVEEAGQAGSSTTTTTYSVDSTTGAITERVGEPVVVNPTETIVKVAAKDKVVETPIEPEVEYVKDVEKDFGTPVQRTEGEKGKTVTTTTYDVDPKDGHITEHVGNPVVTPAGKTIVKVGAKTKVEQSKDSEGLDVIDTTTYEVDPKTGKVTPTTVRTYGTRKEPKVELEQDPKIGDVTVTPKKPDGSTYPPGTTVEIPGKGDKPIKVTIGEDGKGKVPNSELPEGKVPGTGKITEPGKPAVEVPVENPAKVTIFENGVLPASIELPELMIEVRWIDEDGNVLKSSVKTGKEKDAEYRSIPGYEFVRTVIAENEPVITHIFRKVSGRTNSNPATPPKVTIFENGVLPDSIELPELMIEVRWIDEDGNVLKPSVKTGNEKDAEHGSIPGYEFVRTVIAETEPVIIHIFRKVSGTTNTIPVTPDTNGNSGHDTPELTTPTPIPVVPVMPDANGNSGQDTAALTTSIPDSVTPNSNHEDTTDTIDNGVKLKDSQNVLPNTGTESNETLASLGLLGMLSGIGFVFGKKKED